MNPLEDGDDDTASPISPTPSPSPPKRDFESSDLFRAVHSHVQAYMARFDPSHDFAHVLRVLALSKHLLAAELAADPHRKLHKPAVLLAALLHDVGDAKYTRADDDEGQAARAVPSLLAAHGCPPRFAAKVALLVQHVSFSAEVRRPQLVRALVAAHPELAIVQDADRLDAIGAVGIGRTFAYGAAKAPERGMCGSIEHFTEKLERIEGMMKTETGRRMARERTRRLQEFRRWWEEEEAVIS